jgi:glutathione synthase/RimK-type ligase-like ATP-grasp enzyme
VRRLAFLTLQDPGDFVMDDALAIAELAGRDIHVDQVPWRRPAVDWRAYDGVVIRTTWDYQRDLPGFFSLIEHIERMQVPLANPASLVRWNARKTYLADLAARGVPTVPTRRGRGLSAISLRELHATLAIDELVLKPVVGANADDTYRLGAGTSDDARAEIAARFADREWMVQPFLSAILDEGEISTFHFSGRYSHAVVKRPKEGDFRVQEEHGGLIEPCTPDAETRRVADAVLAALGEPPLQARVDLVHLGDGTLALMELEVIEPALYFRMHEDAARNFADAVEAWLRPPA